MGKKIALFLVTAACALAAYAQMVGPNVRVSAGNLERRYAADIRLNVGDPQKILAASDSSSGRAVFYRSLNGGAAWSETRLPLTGTDAFQVSPSVDWTSNGQAWATVTGYPANSTTLRGRLYSSNDNGATWVYNSDFSGAQTASYPRLWSDKSDLSPFKDNLYVIWNNGAGAYMNRRPLGGAWGAPVQVSGAESSGATLGADVRTNENGDVFGFWPSMANRRIVTVRSTNGGASYAAPVVAATTFDSFDIGIPAYSSRRVLIYTTGAAHRTARENLVFAAWTDLSGETGCTSPFHEPGANVLSPCKTRIWFTRSTDGGATWEAARKIHNPPSLNDQFYPWLTFDPVNRVLGLAYYDTVADPGRKATHVYFQYSDDAGLNWSAPVQVTSAQIPAGTDYFDFLGLTGHSCVFFPAWTDRRNGAIEEVWTAKVNPCV